MKINIHNVYKVLSNLQNEIISPVVSSKLLKKVCSYTLGSIIFCTSRRYSCDTHSCDTHSCDTQSCAGRDQQSSQANLSLSQRIETMPEKASSWLTYCGISVKLFDFTIASKLMNASKLHTSALTLSLLLLLPLLITSCGDGLLPGDEAENFVEAYLMVGEPIQGIIVSKTQSLTKKFDFEDGLIRNAEVKILGDGQEFVLVSKNRGDEGYFLEDTSYLVKAGVEYKLEITYPDGSKVTGSTTTPTDELSWVRTTMNPLQFPFDTIRALPTDTITWDGPEDTFKLIAVRALDTLRYGIYLRPSSAESNRRIDRPWLDEADFLETSTWNLLASNTTPVVWSAFKWFGLQEVAIYLPDDNMLKWFVQSNFISAEFDPNLNSLDGAIGVFGSSSTIRDTAFVIKNQP